MCKMGNCTCQRPSSHTSSCLFCRCHLDFKVGFSYFTLPLSDLFSCSTNFKYENLCINFCKLPIIEDVCLRFPSAPFHVILQKWYTNDMAVCNTSPASSGINLMQLLYNQTGDWSVWETLLGNLASLTQCEFQALMANTVMLLLLFKGELKK